jgi:hypothetical protein
MRLFSELPTGMSRSNRLALDPREHHGQTPEIVACRPIPRGKLKSMNFMAMHDDEPALREVGSDARS